MTGSSRRGARRLSNSACPNPPPSNSSIILRRRKPVLGTLPTQDEIVFERFFDEVGDTHLVIHSPYGSRLNRAWGLAIRKRFCRKFNFELQAAALEDSIVLSLGPTHSFPLEEVAGYLKPATVRATSCHRPYSPRRCFRRTGAGRRVLPWPCAATATGARYRRSFSATTART